MKERTRIGLVFAALALVAPEVAVSQAGDTFVKGTTDFLLDRANDNYIYIFQRKVESNPLVRKYLPATLRVAKAGDLRSLLTHKNLWKDALKQDLDGDRDRLFNMVLDELQAFVDSLCTREAMSLEETSKRCKTARDQISGARSKSDTLSAPSTPGASTSNTERTLVYLGSPGAGRALDDLTREIGQIRPASCKDAGDAKQKKYTGCVIEILSILAAVAHADYVVNCYFFGNLCSNGNRDTRIANREEDEDFADFRRYALFFAQLADAADTEDRNQVNALLKSVTIPPVSFGIKREPHATRVLVTSYVGGAWTRQTGTSHQQTYLVAAPVGVEISQARDSGNSMSFMFSPLDFGYPLSLKLNGTDTKIKFSDVVVPSAYVFYGWKSYPLAIGAGYARVRNIDNPDRREGRFLVLIAFDMPLFRLH